MNPNGSSAESNLNQPRLQALVGTEQRRTFQDLHTETIQGIH